MTRAEAPQSPTGGPPRWKRTETAAATSARHGLPHRRTRTAAVVEATVTGTAAVMMVTVMAGSPRAAAQHGWGAVAPSIAGQLLSAKEEAVPRCRGGEMAGAPSRSRPRPRPRPRRWQSRVHVRALTGCAAEMEAPCRRHHATGGCLPCTPRTHPPAATWPVTVVATHRRRRRCCYHPHHLMLAATEMGTAVAVAGHRDWTLQEGRHRLQAMAGVAHGMRCAPVTRYCPIRTCCR